MRGKEQPDERQQFPFLQALARLSAVRSEFLRTSVVQQRLACSVGDISPTGVRVRSPVTWIAFVEETK
jgi:prolyl-tRNA editing enzyme YbaK/EbsC (Cys-tRNA(Pro) deacylase)